MARWWIILSLLLLSYTTAREGLAQTTQPTVTVQGGGAVGKLEGTTPKTWVPIEVRLFDPQTVPRPSRIAFRYAAGLTITQDVVTQPGENRFVLFIPHIVVWNSVVTWTDRAGRPIAHSNDISLNYDYRSKHFFQKLGAADANPRIDPWNKSATPAILHESMRPYVALDPAYLAHRDAIFLPASFASILGDDDTQALFKAAKLGTTLVVYADTNPIDRDAPLLRAMPARLGELNGSGRAIQAMPEPDIVTRTSLGLNSVSRPLGLGALAVLDFDVMRQASPGGLLHQVTGQSSSLAPLLPVHTRAASDLQGVFLNEDQMLRELGKPRIGWGGLWIGLFMLGVLAGPLDSLLHKLMGHRCWTWSTVGGWGLCLIGCIAWLGQAGTAMPTRLIARQITLEIDGQSLRQETWLALRSGKAQALKFQPAGEASQWWMPVGLTSVAQQSTGSPTEFCQSSNGTTPRTMLLEAGETRLLRGVSTPSQPALIQAKLAYANGAISGTITNASASRLTGVELLVESKSVKLPDLEPGGTLTLDPIPAPERSTALPGPPEAAASFNAMRRTFTNGSLLDLPEPIAPRVLVRIVADVATPTSGVGLTLDTPVHPVLMHRVIAIVSANR